MTENVAVYNIALIFDAVNTYSATFRDYLEEIPTTETTKALQTDSNEFFFYLIERLEAVQQKYHEDIDTSAELNDDLRRCEDEIDQLKHSNQELSNQHYTSQQTIQNQNQTIQQLQLQIARLQGGNGRIGGNMGKNGSGGWGNEHYDGLENKVTMLHTNINLLETELDTANQHIAIQNKEIEDLNSVIRSNESTFQEYDEKMIQQDVLRQKIQNDMVQLETKISSHKQSYIKVKTDYYKLQNTNVALRQELSDVLLGNLTKSAEIRPLQAEISKWKKLYEDSQLNTALITTQTLAAPDDVDLGLITTSQQQLQLIQSLQLELKMMRFERDLNTDQLNAAQTTLQNWDSTIQTYHNLYSKYFTTLTSQQEIYKKTLEDVGARYGAISTLLQLFLKAIPQSLTYRQAYFNTLTRLATAQMDTQLLIARAKQHGDCGGVDQFSHTTLSNHSNNNNNTHSKHTSTTHPYPTSNTRSPSSQPFHSHKISNTTLIHHLKSLRLMMIHDKQRLTAPLAFATQVYSAFHVLLKKYQQLSKRMAKVKTHQYTVKQLQSERLLSQTHIKQLSQSLESLQDRYEGVMGELNEANSDYEALFVTAGHNKSALNDLTAQYHDMTQSKKDMESELHDLELRYGHLMEQKVVLQTMYQRSGRENDALRALLNSNGIIYHASAHNNHHNNSPNNLDSNPSHNAFDDPQLELQNQITEGQRRIAYLERALERKDSDIVVLKNTIRNIDADWAEKCNYYQKLHHSATTDLNHCSTDLQSSLDQVAIYSTRCDELKTMLDGMEVRCGELEGDLEQYVDQFVKFQRVGMGIKRMIVDGYFDSCAIPVGVQGNGDDLTDGNAVIAMINQLFEDDHDYDDDDEKKDAAWPVAGHGLNSVESIPQHTSIAYRQQHGTHFKTDSANAYQSATGSTGLADSSTHVNTTTVPKPGAHLNTSHDSSFILSDQFEQMGL